MKNLPREEPRHPTSPSSFNPQPLPSISQPLQPGVNHINSNSILISPFHRTGRSIIFISSQLAGMFPRGNNPLLTAITERG
ncbi:hypothetical protein Hdeb2414_s0022g00612011 [Helianthus debilis subsp. tardiflorus]